MIYIGDGFSDVPCMKLVKVNGGHSIAVYQPSSPTKKKIAENLVDENRVNFIASADYSSGRDLERIVCGIIDKIVADSKLNKMIPNISPKPSETS